MNPNTFYVGLRMQEWGMGEQSRRIQSSVRRVLNELTGEALLFLKDPRLEVKVLSDADLQRVSGRRGLSYNAMGGNMVHPSLMIGHSVWAYFPIDTLDGCFIRSRKPAPYWYSARRRPRESRGSSSKIASGTT